MPVGFTGTLRQARISSPSFSEERMKISLHSSRSFNSLGKKIMPTAYRPKEGRCTPSFRHSSKRNSCGTWICIPAPSPVLASQPQAPRCSIFSRMVNASETILWLLLLLILATNPIPHASCSNSGRYNPMLLVISMQQCLEIIQ